MREGEGRGGGGAGYQVTIIVVILERDCSVPDSECRSAD